MEREILKLLKEMTLGRLKSFVYSEVDGKLSLEFFEPNKSPVSSITYSLPNVVGEVSSTNNIPEFVEDFMIPRTSIDKKELIDTTSLTVDDMDTLLIEDPMAYEMVITGGTPHD